MVRSDREQLGPSVNGDVLPSSQDGWSESVESHSKENMPKHNLHVFACSLNGLVFGFLTTLAGLFQVIVFPMLCGDGSWTISFDLSSFYGFTVWSGVALIITSATGYRTTVAKRQSTVNRYLAMMMLTSIIYSLAVAFIIAAFAQRSFHELNGCMVAGHAIAAAFVCLGACMLMTMMFLGFFIIFRRKPLELFTYCAAGFMEHCCPPIGQREDYANLSSH